ncbi:hypothetical protein AAFX30_06520 [Vibrio chagasii]|uniref:hypothetical protein n=1 Tax=Vibrio chagasii TaxID=170679 RepID=UPI0038CD32A0
MTETQNVHPFKRSIKNESNQEFSKKKPTNEQREKKEIRERIKQIKEQQAWEALWGKEMFE